MLASNTTQFGKTRESFYMQGTSKESSEKVTNYLGTPVFTATRRVVAIVVMEDRRRIIRSDKKSSDDIEKDLVKTVAAEFSQNDRRVMEAFGIFCGLGINNAQLYERALR